MTLSVGVGAAVFLVVGLLLAGGAAGLAWTNTEAFCISCHEMRAFPYEEYKDTIHSSNRTGVRAICSDCHVPREPGPMLMAKVRATKDLWGHLIGTLNTEEKFEAHRAQLAQNVWRRMKKTDSLECRNCHKEQAWSPDLQSESSKAQHAKGKADGRAGRSGSAGALWPRSQDGVEQISMNHAYGVGHETRWNLV
jgi:cytochrome c-type protein NapC